jgi:hypothetical protein
VLVAVDVDVAVTADVAVGVAADHEMDPSRIKSRPLI